jgi:hypothetical protein
MHALVFGKARTAARTLLARADHVWMWPGIPLTEKRGAARVPIAADAARNWITGVVPFISAETLPRGFDHAHDGLTPRMHDLSLSWRA